MYTITFYSFKGGVGRTMALVNVAAQLAKMGRKVLVVDFDLEAPGLETFERLRPPQPHLGLVEFVTEYVRSMRSPDVREYIYSVGEIGKKGGQLWVMPAGRRDRDYHLALSRLDWRKLYEKLDGFLLFEDLKAQWEQEYNPDYVLIDSRTGHCDVKGICTRQLPDAVVLLFFPNEQNLVGLKSVYREIRREGAEGLRKNIRLHFVMSNVPDLDDEDRVLRRRQEAFHKELGIVKLDAIIHRYESVMLFNQAIFVLERPRSRLTREYRRLAQTLNTANPEDRVGVLKFLRQYAQPYLPSVASDVSSEVKRKLVGEEVASSDLDESEIGNEEPLSASDPLNKIASHFLDDIEILHKIAECRILKGEFEIAVRLLDRVLKLQPNQGDSLFLRAECKIKLRQSEKATDDLMTYLRLPDSDVMRGLTKLRDIAPPRLLEAVDLLMSQKAQQARESTPTPKKLTSPLALPPNLKIHGVSLIQIARLLSTLSVRKDCTSRAAQLLRDSLAELNKTQKNHYWQWRKLGLALLQAQCWREVIQFHEPIELDYLGIDALLELTLAFWGEKGEMPQRLCQRALEAEEGDPEAGGGHLERYAPEVKAWFLWRVGDVSNAINWLDKAEQTGRSSLGKVFSWWRCQEVSVEQYLDDCVRTRRMIQGEPICPDFLGSPLASRAGGGVDTLSN